MTAVLKFVQIIAMEKENAVTGLVSVKTNGWVLIVQRKDVSTIVAEMDNVLMELVSVMPVLATLIVQLVNVLWTVEITENASTVFANVKMVLLATRAIKRNA